LPIVYIVYLGYTAALFAHSVYSISATVRRCLPIVYIVYLGYTAAETHESVVLSSIFESFLHVSKFVEGENLNP
jgi:hypothetical protein